MRLIVPLFRLKGGLSEPLNASLSPNGVVQTVHVLYVTVRREVQGGMYRGIPPTKGGQGGIYTGVTPYGTPLGRGPPAFCSGFNAGLWWVSHPGCYSRFTVGYHCFAPFSVSFSHFGKKVELHRGLHWG